MNTKWNALGFRPGLVGGHCIGVDPYYFTYEAEVLGYHSQIILAGRKVNDSMGTFVGDAAIRDMVLAGMTPKTARTVILGFTFKENCPDLRNSKVKDIYDRLREYGINPLVCDPQADPAECKALYDVTPVKLEEIRDADCVIIAVAHKEYAKMGPNEILALFGKKKDRVLIDVKGILSRKEMSGIEGLRYWRL